MAPATSYAVNTQPLDPKNLYPLHAFIRCSGVSKSRLSTARQQGINLTTLKVGRRVFIRGCDGIEFIEKLANSEQV